LITENVRRWLIKAIEDWKVIVHEMKLTQEEVATSAVCFHCQQFMEKVLKAYLTLKKVDFGKTHNLEFLLELCKRYDPDFGQIDPGNLTFYAVAIRYPDEFYLPSFDEAKESYEIVQGFKGFVEKKLDVQFDTLIQEYKSD